MDYVPDNKPFYPDKNVSPSAFSEDTLLIREMFITIQGEMPFAGTPSLFVRLGGCNRGAKVDIGCNACDTDFRMVLSKTYTIDQAVEEMQKLLSTAPNVRLIVITGGEPMLQAKALKKLLPYFVNYTIQFETNGDFNTSWDYLDNLRFVISPKFPHKKNPWWIEQFSGNKWHTPNGFGRFDKFFIRQVISSNPTSPYYLPEYLTKIDDFLKGSVYLSPQTAYQRSDVEIVVDHIKTQANIDHAVKLCIAFGFKLSLQSHVFAGIR